MSPFRWKGCGCSVYSVSRASVFGRIFLSLVLEPKGHLSRRWSGLGDADDEGKAHLVPTERGKATKTRKSVGAARAADEVRFPWPAAVAVFLPADDAFRNDTAPPRRSDRTRPVRRSDARKSLCTPRVHRSRRVVLRLYTAVYTHFTIAYSARSLSVPANTPL